MKDLVLLSIGFLKFRENQYISLTWTGKRELNVDPLEVLPGLPPDSVP